MKQMARNVLKWGSKLKKPFLALFFSVFLLDPVLAAKQQVNRSQTQQISHHFNFWGGLTRVKQQIQQKVSHFSIDLSQKLAKFAGQIHELEQKPHKISAKAPQKKVAHATLRSFLEKIPSNYSMVWKQVFSLNTNRYNHSHHFNQIVFAIEQGRKLSLKSVFSKIRAGGGSTEKPAVVYLGGGLCFQSAPQYYLQTITINHGLFILAFNDYSLPKALFESPIQSIKEDPFSFTGVIIENKNSSSPSISINMDALFLNSYPRIKTLFFQSSLSEFSVTILAPLSQILA